MTQRREEYRCRTCGSTNLVFDTQSSWNAEAQQWEFENCYDHAPFCTQCEEETCDDTYDHDTGEKLAWAYGCATMVPEAEAEAINAAYSKARREERDKRDAENAQLSIAADNAKALAAGYEEGGA